MRVEVRGPDGQIKYAATKTRPVAYLFKRTIIKGPDGKIKSDTGNVPSHSYTYAFIRFLEGFLTGSMKSMKDINNVTRTPNPGGGMYEGDNKTYQLMNCKAGEDDDTFGIVLGKDDTPEANMNYKLNTKITHGTGTDQLEYSPQSFVAPQIIGAYVNYVLIRSFYNNSGAPITAKEFGIYCKAGQSGYIFCFIRDTEAAGKTVIAGDTMTVQYTLKVGAGFTIQWWQLLGNPFEAPIGSSGPYASYNIDKTYRGSTMYFNSYYVSGTDNLLSFVINAGDNIATYGIVLGNAGLATGVITGVTNPGGGLITVVCSAAHGLGPGQSVTIAGTTNYNGTYTIVTGSGSSFTVTKTYVSSQTGTWSLPGDDPESLSDYKLQHQITHGNGAGQLDYNATSLTTTAEVGGNLDFIMARSYYNATANPVIAREIAWYLLVYRIDYTYHGIADYFCTIRDLLAGDVVVDPDDTLTVQYTLRTNVAT